MTARPVDTVLLAVELAAPGGIAAVDALARLQLEARRLGLELRVASAPRELRELIALAGLEAALGLEALGQAE